MARSHVSLWAVLAVLASPVSSVAGVYAPSYSGGGGGGSASPAGSSGDLQTNNGSGGFTAITPGSGVAALLATFNSANLRSALTDETGTGAAVFATSPTLTVNPLSAVAPGFLRKLFLFGTGAGDATSALPSPSQGDR